MHRTYVAGAVLLAASELSAQQPSAPVYEGEGLVVSASRLPNTPSGLAQSVTIITGEELRRNNPASTKEALGTAVGIHVDQVGKAGGFSSVYVRGAEQSHLLILIDGIRVNDATTTRGSTFDLSEIDLASIERIEVLRGPGSAVHGGEALAGVLNIVTKQAVAGKPKAALHAGVGEFGYLRGGASVGGGSEAVRYSFTAGHEAAGKHSEEEAYQRLNTVGASVKFTPSKNAAVDLTLRHARRKSESFPDGSGGELFALNRDLESKQSRDTIAGLGFALGDEQKIRVETKLSLFKREEESATPAVLPITPAAQPVPERTDDTDYDRRSVQVTVRKSFGDLVNVAVGAELQKEDGTLDEDLIGLAAGLTQLNRDTQSFFVETSVAPSSRFSIQLGARYDSFDGDGSLEAPAFGLSEQFDLERETQVTPHVGAVWTHPNEKTKLRASYSRGFKAPSFFALGNFLVGNRKLEPERSRNLELGWEQRLGTRARFQLTAFRVDYRNMVDLVADPSSLVGIALTNRGTIVSKGIESSVRAQLGEKWSVEGGLTLFDLNVRDGLEQLANRPERKMSIGATFEPNPRHSFTARAVYEGDRIDQPQAFAGIDIRKGGYTTVDASWRIKLDVASITLSVDNVFDKDYQVFHGFESLERRFRLDARAEF